MGGEWHLSLTSTAQSCHDSWKRLVHPHWYSGKLQLLPSTCLRSLESLSSLHWSSGPGYFCDVCPSHWHIILMSTMSYQWYTQWNGLMFFSISSSSPFVWGTPFMLKGHCCHVFIGNSCFTLEFRCDSDLSLPFHIVSFWKYLWVLNLGEILRQ